MSRPLSWAAVAKRCAAKPGAVLDHPWDPEGHVYKVGGKIFAFLGAEGGPRGSFKCDRERIDEWRSRYPDAIGPAPYLTNKPWNNVVFRGVDPDDMAEIIDDSYEQVVLTLAKKHRPKGWDTGR